MDNHCIIPYFISGMIEPSQLYISAPSDQNLGFWKALGAHTSNKNGSKNNFLVENGWNMFSRIQSLLSVRE
jgi:hypothetical protein